MTERNVTAEQILEIIRSIVSDLPGTSERLSHGAPCFYVGRKPLCYFHDPDFSADNRASLWCPAPPGDQDHYIQHDPTRFFAPTPSASGVFADWIGAYVDGVGNKAVSPSEIRALIEDAYRHVATRSLVAQLDRPADADVQR